MAVFPARESLLKKDLFGRIVCIRSGAVPVIRRDYRGAPLPRLAGWLARNEAACLRRLERVPAVPRVLAFRQGSLDRSYIEGRPMYEGRPRDIAYFRAARRLIQAVHRAGVCHNDLAKESNWLVRDDGTPAVVDFQIAVRGNPRARWMRLLAREDLRHLLKHKRTYCPERLTPVERRLLARPSWLRECWFATGKPVYRFITRRLLGWRDNEGRN
ncbi:phosphotransferase [Coralloluteibacterium thermophilus]|uniref:non-specific serine/threonine protein kinase n=1 Tax=Coralloluteibacterium thermophilum TaxID=2707049 RepID=A0ABV9NEB5_9GAMM